ncbi:flagellar basal body-associated protein FliL [Rhodovulum sp. P5]|uniref:flagellar basal body-associated FliL family protein n=1 Tax=Rhodovulum sp. P5 TaxID=1564506 RepID=UPI0009C39F48|nr:flagellar basal body-associated FliL family protein [Rhodovulum sp. P5]ARE40415.1 flagellar basal body-associated protein FliL [Rhodovulum sp. P5]
MAATEMEEAEEPAKKSKMPLIIGVVLALVLGGGAFFAIYSGMILGGGHEETGEEMAHDDGHGNAGGHGDGHGESKLLDVEFVELEKLIISLGPNAHSKHLQFRAQLEVPPEYRGDVERVTPRILDVLNSYLRAVDVAELERPTALITLRGQMLRRVQLVTGPERVRDLLVTEFVLN